MRFLNGLKGDISFYSTLGSVNLGALCMGMTVGWVEPSLSYFINLKKPYNETTSNDSIVQTTMNFGAGFGALMPMCLVDIYGRKISFQVAGIVNSASWIVLSLASNETFYMTAAFIGGMAAGIFLTTLTLYVAEISSSRNRGTTGALASFCASIGIILTDCMVIFTNYRILAYVMIVISLLFLGSVPLWMIESPYFLYQRGKTLEAKMSLKALRGVRTVLEVDEEFKLMQRFFDRNRCSTPKTALCQVFYPQNTKKTVAIIFLLLCISQMVGGHAIDDYAEKIIDIAVPHYGKLLLSSLDVLSVGICLYMIEKVGRKPLLIISIIGSALCCFILAVYRYALQNECQNIEERITIPVVIIVIYFSVYSLGLIPILPILTGEIFPSRIKTTAVGLCMMFIYLIATIMQKLYQLLNEKTGTCLSFVAFTLFGSMGLPLTIASLPETKGKSLYQIQDEMDELHVVIP